MGERPRTATAGTEMAMALVASAVIARQAAEMVTIAVRRRPRPSGPSIAAAAV